MSKRAKAWTKSSSIIEGDGELSAKEGNVGVVAGVASDNIDLLLCV